MLLQENVSLAPHTTFRIGGMARFFVVCENIEDIKSAQDFVKKNNLDYFILGGGSNILVSDQGFNGLVIKIALKGIVEEKINEDQVRVIASAGEDWDNFVAYTVDRGFSGLENLSLIPGTVGATPVQNIGAYGVEVKDTIEWVEFFNPKTLSLEKFSNKECQFGYRDSYFKKEGKGLIITKVSFILSKKQKSITNYKDLSLYFEKYSGTPSVAEIRKAVIDIRTKKLPDVKKIGTAGSFFKNPIVSRQVYEKLLLNYKDMPMFEVDEKTVKIPAGWLIDKVCGLKGAKRGGVGIYEKQALVLINLGNGTAKEIQILAQEIVESVKEKTGIVLESEVQYVGV